MRGRQPAVTQCKSTATASEPTWNATSPNQFATFTANDSASDLGSAADGTMFALQANGTTEIRAVTFRSLRFLQLPNSRKFLAVCRFPASPSTPAAL